MIQTQLFNGGVKVVWLCDLNLGASGCVDACNTAWVRPSRGGRKGLLFVEAALQGMDGERCRQPEK